MKERITVRMARPWWLLTMGLLVSTVVLGFLIRDEEPLDWFCNAALIGMTGFATVGGLVASRYPRNPIGWLFSAIASFRATAHELGYPAGNGYPRSTSRICSVTRCLSRFSGNGAK